MKITIYTFGRSSKSSQPKLIILSATWSCNALLENWHTEVAYLKSRFLNGPWGTVYRFLWSGPVKKRYTIRNQTKNTLYTFGRSSKSSQPKLIILSATWSSDAPLENWHNEVTHLKLRFLIRPMRHHVSFFLSSKVQKRIHDQKSSKKNAIFGRTSYKTVLIWFSLLMKSTFENWKK